VAEVAKRPHVVIVGAGFAGLAAAKALGGSRARVTIIDRRNHHLFQPLLYQVATAALSPADIAEPIRAVLRRHANVEVLLDEVIDIDLDRRWVRTREHADQSYDVLILATGAGFSYFGHDEWAAHAPGLKSVEDAVRIRNRLLLAFEKAETARDPAVKQRLLTFVLVGGGPTGVEMAGAIAELARATLARDFRHIDPTAARILLVEAGPRILSGFPDGLADYAQQALEGMGVEVRLDSPVEAVNAEGAVIGGECVPAANVVWCAGVEAGPVAKWLGVPTEQGGTIRVKPDLSLLGRPEVFLAGDIAHLEGEDGKPLPGLAAVAQQQGAYLGRLLAARIEGKPDPGPFRYNNRGTMATIGRSAAVADLPRARLTGRIAWLLWGLVHIYQLVGFENRLRVFVTWMWSWATYGRGARLITDAPAAGAMIPRRRERDEPASAKGDKKAKTG
jgi:NADH:ubiquinone reductase (H+-translocating)